MWHIILPILLFLTSVFLILLVLIQRGRGGGLAGAFGGLGGQSAFGTKAGDLFTRITIGVAAFWIILCAASVKLLNDSQTSLLNPGLGTKSAPLDGGAAGGAGATPPEKSDSGTPTTEPATGEPSGAAGASDTPAPAASPASEGGKGEGGK